VLLADHPQPKLFRTGTHRTRDPQETLADYLPKAETMGITRLANVTGLDWVGIPVYNAIRPNSRSLSVSQGKGATPAAAKVSALMESIEYWHAEHVVHPLRHESFTQLCREGNVIDIHRLPRRGGLDSTGPGSRQTPARAPLRPDVPLLWMEGEDLLTEQRIWLPFETIRLNKVGLDYAHNTFRVDSNGLASGNTTAEAAVHAICELVERDALTRWWQEARADISRVRSKISLESISDPVCQELIVRFEAARIDVAVWDVTSDTGIPTYQCCVLEQAPRPGWRPFGASWGYGTHLAAEVALSRALTEAAQSRVTAIAGSRDDNFPTQYQAQYDPSRVATTRQALFSGEGAVDFGLRPSLSTPTVNEDLATLLDCLRKVAVGPVAIVDLSRTDFGIPVVKVVGVGLEPFSLFIGYTPRDRANTETAGRAGRR
jgi:YcaO-like protein with predicted kinase domain